MEWLKKENGLYMYQIYSDMVCIVRWNLLKRDIIKRVPQCMVTSKGAKKGLHQLLRPSQNQFKWRAHIKGKSKTFYSDNLEIVKKLIINHALQHIKQIKMELFI